MLQFECCSLLQRWLDVKDLLDCARFRSIGDLEVVDRFFNAHVS